MAIHFVVEAARITEIVSGTIPTPEWGRSRSTIDTLTALGVF